MPAQEKKFIERAIKKGYDKKKIEELFNQMKTFAEYGFNKSHSTAYAYLAYQTAFLKAHYPVYFMSAPPQLRIGKDRHHLQDHPVHLREQARWASTSCRPTSTRATRISTSNRPAPSVSA